MKKGAYIEFFLLVFIGLGFFCTSKSAHAKEGLVCQAVSVRTSIRELSGRHNLLFIVNNPTAKPIEIFRFYFGENMLRFRATTMSSGTELPQVIPLISPGVKNIVIEPGGKFSQEIYLDNVFPGLRTALLTNDVLISWELQVKPNNACFSQKIATSMTLKKFVR